jgi:glycosyltransferase involved in cell wall biosynthesis
MRRSGLRALVAGGDVQLQRLAAALEHSGVEVRRAGDGTDGASTDTRSVVTSLLELDTTQRSDLVVVGGTDLLAASSAEDRLAGRLWAVAARLPSDLELLAAIPPAIADAAGRARWVVCPSERTRGLIDTGVPAAAKRSVVLPLDPAGGEPGADGLDAAVSALLDRTFPAAPWQERNTALRVVVAGHALHFLDAVTQWLRGLPDVELRIDHVPSFARHDEAVSREHVAWADTVVCEWASPVAAWYSRNKRPGQRLVVRLHRAELYSTWWHGIDIEAVDQVVCVSRHYARLTHETTAWPMEKIVVIPNYVDAAVLDRPKLAGSPFAIGMMGVTPRRKRLDLALDLLERLRERDPRFSLHVKSQFAWDLPWAWRDPDERGAAEQVVRRVRGSALLADGVVFDAYGPDVGAWLRKIGWVVSLSDDESFHLAPAEGMASGAVPLIRAWPGVDTIYDGRWIASAGDEAGTVDELADRVLTATRDQTWDRLRHDAQAQARASFDVVAVCERFGRLLVGDLPVDEPSTAARTVPRVEGAVG